MGIHCFLGQFRFERSPMEFSLMRISFEHASSERRSSSTNARAIDITSDSLCRRSLGEYDPWLIRDGCDEDLLSKWVVRKVIPSRRAWFKVIGSVAFMLTVQSWKESIVLLSCWSSVFVVIGTHGTFYLLWDTSNVLHCFFSYLQR
jgi:hypothetical protein